MVGDSLRGLPCRGEVLRSCVAEFFVCLAFLSWRNLPKYTLLKQKCVIHTFLVWFSSLHRAYHFLVCYAYYRYVIHTQNGMKCTL